MFIFMISFPYHLSCVDVDRSIYNYVITVREPIRKVIISSNNDKQQPHIYVIDNRELKSHSILEHWPTQSIESHKCDPSVMLYRMGISLGFTSIQT